MYICNPVRYEQPPLHNIYTETIHYNIIHPQLDVLCKNKNDTTAIYHNISRP